MPGEFKSLRSYRDFVLSVTRHWRHVRTQDDREFIDTFLATSAGKEEVIPQGSVLWRAQIGHVWIEELPAALPMERMKPPKTWEVEGRAPEGRINPKGIPCLYTATQEEIAIAEVRPWKGSFVSVALLKTSRELRVVNCTTDEEKVRKIVYFGEPGPEERGLAVWRDIDRGFSEPVSPSDDQASYAPTQILAEFFRQKGLDGIAYRSSLGRGHNIALFDLDSARVDKCSLVEITDIRLEHSRRST